LFEGPVTALFAEDQVELHGLPGGRLRLAVGDSADLHHDRYVVRIQVVTREEAKSAGQDLSKVHEVRSEPESRVVWGGSG
jgi:hypothetical protein